MTRIFTYLFISFFFVSMNFSVQAATAPSTTSGPVIPETVLKKIASLKIKDIQRLTGKKLTLKQKISFLLLKHKLKKKADEKKDPGQTSLVFGIMALALLLIGLFVPYVILGSLVASIVAIVTGSVAKKKNPDDRKAHAGKLLGWISLGLFGFILILAVIALSSWSW